mmetsp:Transcript_37881/g.89251  ORF Transcript_37881/g.89251 Transcript_37881/m.89251 type:complete len:145 (+) Transcript_37881:65-499(+)
MTIYAFLAHSPCGIQLRGAVTPCLGPGCGHSQAMPDSTAAPPGRVASRFEGEGMGVTCSFKTLSPGHCAAPKLRVGRLTEAALRMSETVRAFGLSEPPTLEKASEESRTGIAGGAWETGSTPTWRGEVETDMSSGGWSLAVWSE